VGDVGSGVAEKLIGTHLVAGEMRPGAEIGLKIDQTLTQHVIGTMVMLELEALGLDWVATVSVHGRSVRSSNVHRLLSG
jgi:aconitate hydratase